MFRLRYGLVQHIRVSFMDQIVALKPQRLRLLVGELLIPESLSNLLTIDIATLTCAVDELVYCYQNPDAEDRLRTYIPEETRANMLSLTRALEMLDAANCNVTDGKGILLLPMSKETAMRRLITPRILRLSEILYPLRDAVQVVTVDEDEDDKDRLHVRLKQLYDKWDDIMRKDNLSSGLPEFSHLEMVEEEHTDAATVI